MVGPQGKSTAKMVVVKYSKTIPTPVPVETMPTIQIRLALRAACALFIAQGPLLIGHVAAPHPGQPQLSDRDREIFPDEVAEEKGWKGLARLLEALEPNVDTAIPLTPSEITDRIAVMLDQGRAAEALEVIEKRKAQYAQNPDPLGN